MQDLFLTNYTDKTFLDKIKESFNRCCLFLIIWILLNLYQRWIQRFTFYLVPSYNKIRTAGINIGIVVLASLRLIQ